MFLASSSSYLDPTLAQYFASQFGCTTGSTAFRNVQASMLQQQGRYAKAASLQRETWEVLVCTMGPRHPDTLTVKSALASTLEQCLGWNEPWQVLRILPVCLWHLLTRLFSRCERSEMNADVHSHGASWTLTVKPSKRPWTTVGVQGSGAGCMIQLSQRTTTWLEPPLYDPKHHQTSAISLTLRQGHLIEVSWLQEICWRLYSCTIFSCPRSILGPIWMLVSNLLYIYIYMLFDYSNPKNDRPVERTEKI